MKKRINVGKKNKFRTKVALRDGYACAYCGTCKPPFELEHVIPLSKGGKNHITNFVFSCNMCNQKKTDMLPNEIQDVAFRKRIFDILAKIRR